MKDYAVIALLLLGAGYAALKTPRPASHEPAPAPQVASAPAAISGTTAPDRVSVDLLTSSLDYLERDGAAWMHGETPLNRDNGCISCHVVSFALWSHRAVERVGGPRRAAVDDLMDEAMEFIARPGIGRAATWSQMLLARSSADAASYDWQGSIDGVVESQEADGRWRARGQFPQQRRGEREGDGVATMWALLALDWLAERGASAEDAMAEAYTWLTAEPEGRSSEWLAMRLLTELRLGNPKAAHERLARVIDAQRSDGGWSWLTDEATDPSDAYSTGVTLYALRRAGLEPSHPAVLAAVDYLLQTRHDDGRWTVSSALTSAEESEERDYIYEYWGTAWAVIGLAEVLPVRTADADL